MTKDQQIIRLKEQLLLKQTEIQRLQTECQFLEKELARFEWSQEENVEV